MQLRDAIDDYIAFIRHEQGVAKTTYTGYKSYLHAYTRYMGTADINVKDALTTENLRRYLYRNSEAGLRPRSIRSTFFPLRGMIRFLINNGVLICDPMQGIVMPKLDAPIRHSVSDQECALLLAACDRIRDQRRGKLARALLSCLIYCGVRASELLALKISDVSIDRGTLEVVHGKGSRSRILYPTPDTFTAIKDWLLVRSTAKKVITTDHLWAYDKQRRIAYNGLSTLFEEVKYIAGLADRKNIHPHSLRRGFATRLMTAGAPIKSIQAALGHSDPNITFVYLADANEPAKAMQDLARLSPASGALLSMPNVTVPAKSSDISTLTAKGVPSKSEHLRRRRLSTGASIKSSE